jgi:hypothetical protein
MTMNLRRTLGLALSATLVAVTGAHAQSGQALLDGKSLAGWQHAGAGRFVAQPDGSILAEGGAGVLTYTGRTFRDFALDLDFMADSPGAKSGIFVRVPEQPKSPADALKGGYEIQIDNLGDPTHATGAIADVAAPTRMAGKSAEQWNHYRIEVTGQRYQVYLNGEKVNDFFGDRARQGYIALENHDVDSRVRFKNVRVSPLQVANGPNTLGELFAVKEKRAPI